MAGSNYFSQGGNIIFADNCKYEIDEKSCVNKLYGFCLGLFGVHKNSIRFGWTYNKETDNIDLWKYVYSDGKLTKKVIASCKTGEEHSYLIEGWICKDENNDTVYDIRFRLDGNKIDTAIVKSNKWFAWTLGPYFGGNTKAPHKINILEC